MYEATQSNPTRTQTAAESQPDAPRAPAGLEPLATGTRLAEFELQQVLGFGGFGVVYLALDHALLRQVAIKEYLPATLACRGPDAQVLPRSEADAETYAAGLQSFVNEARLLARFDHPSLVKVLRYWEAHGTAYMAMPYYPGRTLKDERREMPQAPEPQWLARIVEPLLGALDTLHRDGVYHRDVSPDNIVLLPSGVPVLLDFGAARQIVGDRTQTLTAVLKPNFAPVEQYLDLSHTAEMRQGPWTDVYALGAVLRFMITGAAPVPAAVRAVRDVMPPLARVATLYPGYPPQFLATIDWAMALAPLDRPQSVAALRAAFAGGLQDAPAPGEDAPAPAAQALAAVKTARTAPWRQRPRLLAALALSSAAGLAWTFGSSLESSDAASPAQVQAPAIETPVAPTAVPLPTPPVEPASPAAPAMVAAPAVARVATAPRPQRAAEVPAAVPTPGAEAPEALALAAPPSAARVSPAVAQAQTSEAAAPDPGEACRDHNFVGRWVCLARECQLPRFSSHATCVQLRAQDAARRQAQLER